MIEWTPDELKKNLDAGTSVFLKLWKPGCGACKLSEPALSRLEPEFQDQLTFVHINTQTHPEMLEISDTEVLPVFFIFKDKKKIGNHIGFKGIKKLKEFVETSLASSPG